MCGLNGTFAWGPRGRPVDANELLRTRDAMMARGPDGAGLWVAADGSIGLGHRRLAIIDLSDNGAQPMATACGRYRIVFNGEIYNYRELQADLRRQGVQFRSQSDTEVLLHLYARKGTAMCSKLRGMFAFAIWDDVEQTLFLARDPFGIKPLYLHDDGGTLRFASQVKALLAGGGITPKPSAEGTFGFWLWGHVPEPYTLYEGITALPPGTWRLQGRDRAATTGSFDSVERMLSGDDDTPFQSLREALLDSVRHHLIADVPVGVFLSAGIDSSVITALATECGSALHTVTLGFEEFRGTPSDETALAEQLARHYGTTQHTVWISKSDFEHSLDAYMDSMDQPSIDGLNTWLVARAAAQSGLKVALSGLGGDEFLGGYPSFRQVPRMRAMARPFGALPGFGRLSRALAAPVLRRFTSEKLAGLFEYGHSWEGAYALRRAVRMPWELGRSSPATLGVPRQDLDDPHAVVSHLEATQYMRNQLLRDSDWASMAHSLELRVPLVDTMLTRHIAAARRRGQRYTKQDLAAAASPKLPPEVASRPKTGFLVPTYQWAGFGNSQGRVGSRRSLHDWQELVHRRQVRQAPLRVLALMTDAYGGHGGIAKFNRDVLEVLSGMPHCTEVVCLPLVTPRPVEGVPANVRFDTTGVGSKPRYVAQVMKAMRQGSYDLVVVGHINVSALGTWVARRLRVPSLLFVHGIDAWTPHKSRAVRNSLSRFDRIVGVSQHTLDRFNSWAAVDRSRQRVLPNCVDLQRFTPGPKPADLVEHYGLDGKTVLMTFGRLASEERFKGFDEIMEVLPRIAASLPNVVYLIGGTGPDQERLQAKARALGLADRVKFTGYIEEARKVDHYRLADAYVMPSRGEGFGIVFLEALACGVPALGSTVDGSKEALLDGKLGELVDPAVPDEVYAGVMRTLDRPRGESIRPLEFSSEAFGQRLRALIADVLGERHGAASATHAGSAMQPGLDIR